MESSRAIYLTAAKRRVVVVRVFLENQKHRGARSTSHFNGPRRLKQMNRTRVDDLHKEWMRSPKYRREYNALEKEFSLSAAMIGARSRAGMTQAQVAKRTKTTQAVIARLEGGGSKPSTRTLERYAIATGHRLRIIFQPSPREL
jgi:ribosome-binding protein aMBF1 (putative translation factor)